MSNDIQAAVAAATNKLIASGAIEQEIEKALAKTVTSLISEQLSSYSEFGKGLQSAVKTALAVNFDKLTLPSYGQSILAMVETAVQAKAGESIAASIKDQLEELLASPEREITLTALVDRFKEHHKDDYDREDRISVHLERDRGSGVTMKFHMLHLSPKQGASHRDLFSWPIRIHLCETPNGCEILGLTIDQKKADNNPMFVLGMGDFPRSLYSMFASKTLLILDVDPDDLDLDLPEREDTCYCD